MSETLQDAWYVENARAFGAPSVRFGPFDDIDAAKEFIDRFLTHGGLVRTFRPEQFDGMDRLPMEVWM